MPAPRRIGRASSLSTQRRTADNLGRKPSERLYQHAFDMIAKP
jgi:hypothetical protein